MEHPEDKRIRLLTRRRVLHNLDPRKALLHSTKSSAKTRKLENSLTLEDLKIPTHCPVFGFKLSTRGRKETSATVDRLDNSKGYTKENIRIISWKANRIKGAASYQELEKILNYLKKELTT